MTTTKTAKSLFAAILLTGLLAGVLDGLAAVINYMINGGKKPEMVFKYIASGVFGKKAFTQGTSMVVWGVFFHLLIATLFTAFFFLIYPKIKWLGENKILAGVLYGIFAWVVMTQLVVPMSQINPPPFQFKKAIVAALILVFFIGLPISLMANKYYLYRK